MISTARQCGRSWAAGPAARGRSKSIRLRPAVAASWTIRRVSAVEGRSQRGHSARRGKLAVQDGENPDQLVDRVVCVLAGIVFLDQVSHLLGWLRYFGCGELMWLPPLVSATAAAAWRQQPQGPTMPANPRTMRSRAARNVFAVAGVHGSEPTSLSLARQVSKVMRRSAWLQSAADWRRRP